MSFKLIFKQFQLFITIKTIYLFIYFFLQFLLHVSFNEKKKKKNMTEISNFLNIFLTFYKIGMKEATLVFFIKKHV